MVANSSALLMHHDPNDLGSLIPKEHTIKYLGGATFQKYTFQSNDTEHTGLACTRLGLSYQICEVHKINKLTRLLKLGH